MASTLVTSNSEIIPIRWPIVLATVFGLYALLGGAISLAGWVLDAPRLTDWLRNGISIQPNASVAILASGAAILLLINGFDRVAACFAVIVVSIGTTALFQILTEIDLGINTPLMFGREWGRESVITPGQMGTPAATSLTLIGIAFILLAAFPAKPTDPKRFVRFTAIIFVIITAAISALSIFGYLFGATKLYSLPLLTAIALQTATFVLAVSVAVVLMVSDLGPTRLMLEKSAPGMMARRIILAALVLPLLFGFIQALGETAGFYDPLVGAAVLTLAEVVFLLGLLWWTARAVERQTTIADEYQRKARELDHRLAGVMGSITDSFVTMDGEWRLTFANEVLAKRLGRKPRELVGLDVRGAFPGLSEHQASVELARAMKQRVNVDFEIFDDTEGKWFTNRAYPTDDGGLAIYSSDITQQKLSEAALRASEQRFVKFMHNLPGLAWIKDRDGRYVYANEAASAAFRVPIGELYGKRDHDIFSHETADAFVENDLRAAASEKGIQTVEVIEGSDGSPRYSIVNKFPILSDGGDAVLIGGMAIDITEQRRAHDELEKRVRERTSELAETNDALRHEIAERKRSEKIRVKLLHGLVSAQEGERTRIAREIHDQLGQRLTALRLKLASLKDVAAANIEIASRVERLQEISSLLDSDVGFFASELRPAVLDDLGLRDALGVYAKEWSGHFDIEVDFYSNGLVGKRFGIEAETQLYRIAQEGLNNIAKHAKCSSVSLMLELTKDYLVLVIEDDGMGFDNFDPKDKGSKTSLGLLGMQERASLIEAEIEIESAPGAGTTILVRLPVQQETKQYDE